MKHILLIATGGTIASEDTENGLAPQISSEKLLDYVPAAREFCTIDAVQILNIDSTNIQPEHWLLMARTVKDNYEKYDGIHLFGTVIPDSELAEADYHHRCPETNFHGNNRCKNKPARFTALCSLPGCTWSMHRI